LHPLKAKSLIKPRRFIPFKNIKDDGLPAIVCLTDDTADNFGTYTQILMIGLDTKQANSYGIAVRRDVHTSDALSSIVNDMECVWIKAPPMAGKLSIVPNFSCSQKMLTHGSMAQIVEIVEVFWLRRY
jgi:hypothetical protein